jgi:5'-nucleotidase / UDP-sugar diphosphatase
MKPRFAVLFAALLLAATAGCPKGTAPAGSAGNQPRGDHRLVVLHTNDMHGYFLPNVAPWLPGRPSIGGMEALDAYVRTVRNEVGDDKLLLFDGGDLLTGTPVTDLEVNGAQGGAMTAFLADVGYDAWTLGNHDFDKGFVNAAALVHSSRVPVVNANLRNPEGGPVFPGVKTSLVIEANGLRVGVIGAITEELPELTSADTLSHLRLRPVADAVRAEVERIDPLTDLIVLVCHCGIESDRALAARVSGIDLIVGGHTHTPMHAPEKVGETWIVQAGSNNRSVGRVDLVAENDGIRTLSGSLVDLTPGTGPAGASDAVKKKVTEYKAEIDARYGIRIGEAAALLERGDKRLSPLGAWTTDQLRTFANADVGLFNGGGLRADLPAGPITLGDVEKVFPFPNAVAVFDMRGEDLHKLLLQNARAETAADGTFVQISGVACTWRLGPLGPEVISANVGGKKLDPSKVYRVVTNSYVVEQWRRHLPAEPQNVTLMPKTVYDVAVEAVKAGTVQLPTDLSERSQKVE